jgi:hypothetical protein
MLVVELSRVLTGRGWRRKERKFGGLEMVQRESERKEARKKERKNERGKERKEVKVYFSSLF